jgi:hypothetical protein
MATDTAACERALVRVYSGIFPDDSKDTTKVAGGPHCSPAGDAVIGWPPRQGAGVPYRFTLIILGRAYERQDCFAWEKVKSVANIAAFIRPAAFFARQEA